MSGGLFMTTSTAGTKPGTPAPRAPARPNTVYVGQTFRTLHLAGGPRPFAVVCVDPDADRASGWLMVNPEQDGEDPYLRELGIQAADRRKPCYITVPTDRLK